MGRRPRRLGPWLVARNAADRTRRAYLTDVAQLAEWAGAQRLGPG